MNLELERLDYELSGIFGVLTDSSQMFLAETLEHSYDSDKLDGTYAPKLPPGKYTCKRSMHRLHGMAHDFETFQIMDVPGHSNILFHWGNYNKDSDGCVLLGLEKENNMITHSKETFEKFMKFLHDVDVFTLTVI